MEKGINPRAFLHGLWPGWSRGSCEIVSRSGNAYEIRPAYVEPMVTGNSIHPRFCIGTSNHPLGGKVIGETGTNGFNGLVEQIGRHIVIFDFISFDI